MSPRKHSTSFFSAQQKLRFGADHHDSTLASGSVLGAPFPPTPRIGGLFPSSPKRGGGSSSVNTGNGFCLASPKRADGEEDSGHSSSGEANGSDGTPRNSGVRSSLRLGAAGAGGAGAGKAAAASAAAATYGLDFSADDEGTASSSSQGKILQGHVSLFLNI